MAEKQQSRREVIMERKRSLVERPDTEVTIVNEQETYALLQMVRLIDRASGKLKNKFATGSIADLESAIDFMKNEYRPFLQQMNSFAKKICEFTNTKYVEPRVLKKMEGE